MSSMEINQPSLTELRQFGLIMAGMIVLMAGLVLPWLWSDHWWTWPFPTAALFALAALTLPLSLGPIYYVWMRLALVLGWINSRVLLGLVFFLLLLPVGLVLKLMGRDPMARRFRAADESYRREKTPRDETHYRQPF